MIRKLQLLALISFAPFIAIQAQEKQRTITGKFDNLRLHDFFSEVEARTPYYFYYDIATLDTNRVNLEFNNATITQVLEKAFAGTVHQFAVADDDRIYITNGLRISTSLPPGYFNTVSQTRPDTIREKDYEEKKQTRSTPTNKLYEIGTRTNTLRGNAILTGHIRNAKTGEPVINASVSIDGKYFTVTDTYGYYTLTVPAGKYTLSILGIGMRDTRLQLTVYNDGKMDVDLQEQITTLKEVTVSARKTANINRVQMGMERLSIESIRKIPSLFGEADVLRVVTSLPGVKTVGEASTGFNVRGGSADQNLILFNDATIYNPSHFFGMFSAFNPEVVKDIELYKSSIPARFGGRLASVLDINSREGNKKTITGSAGIGAITSRLHLEGPIAKDRTSFIFGGRSTYANWLLGLLPDKYKHSRASFQDINLGVSHRIDSSNNLYLSGYFSQDRFALNSDTDYAYKNHNLTLKWKHSFNYRMSGTFTVGIDDYNYKVKSDVNDVNAFTLKFGIRQYFGKTDFVYFANQQHSFDFGASTLRYQLEPGSYEPLGKNSLVARDVVEDEQAQESALYFTHRYSPNTRLSFSSGVRYVLYNYLGPQSVSYYAPGAPVSPGNVTEVREFSKGKSIKNYSAPEFRLSARYAFSSDFSIKAGYNSQRQYIHMLTNTTAIAPTDIWKLSDPNIRPQQGDQVSLGFYKNLKSNTIETSVEVYYKRIRNYLDYKPGADLLLNHTIETDVVSTRGKAYGVEFLVRKPGGKLNGWISYTYSRILLRSDDRNVDLLVNRGGYYPANYDKPHDITFTGNFRVNHRFSLSLNSTYSTGRPITIPVGRYLYGGSQRVLYSDRNAYRIPDYFRTDFSMNIDGNHKVKQKTHNSWTIGAYNLLGRKNPYSVYFVSENSQINGYKMSIFGSIIPFINYNIRF